MVMDRAEWDARYAGEELLWRAEPNQFLVEEVAELPPGRALDVACGEGRNAIWLAEHGWNATGVDFSEVALAKARRLADQRSDRRLDQCRPPSVDTRSGRLRPGHRLLSPAAGSATPSGLPSHGDRGRSRRHHAGRGARPGQSGTRVWGPTRCIGPVQPPGRGRGPEQPAHRQSPAGPKGSPDGPG